MTPEEFLTREVTVKCSEYDTGSAPYVILKVKCKYNPEAIGRWPWMDPQSPSLDVISITSEGDISGLLTDEAFEEIYDKALDKMSDLVYIDGIPPGKFVNMEAEE